MNKRTDIVDNLSLIEVAERFANAKERSPNEFGTLLKNIFIFLFFFVFQKIKKIPKRNLNYSIYFTNAHELF